MANEQLQSTIETLHERRRKRERMTRIGWIVAGVCALILLACLMVPAFTMEHNKYDCGLEEHTHTDKCYTNEVVCGFPTEKAHVHTPSCYNKSNVLTCKKAEAGHIHLAACYDKNGKLDCAKEETVHIHKASCFDKNGNSVCKNKDALHVHGDTCYTEVKAAESKDAKDSDDKDSKATATPVSYKLTCNEKSYGHVHNVSCYNEKGKLVCGEDEEVEIPHKHDDSCYEKALACGQKEHTHTDECLKEEAPIEVEDEGIDQVEADGTDNGAAEGDAAADNGEAAEGDAEGTDAEPSDAAEPDLTDQEIADAEDQGLFYENKDMMVAFTVPDDIKDSVKLTVTETKDEVVPYTDQDLVVSNENGAMVVDTDGTEGGDVEGVQDVASDGAEVPAEDAAAVNDDQPAAQAANVNVAELAGSDEEPAYQINLHVEATLNGQPVENISDLGITAKLQMKSKVISPLLKDIDFKEVAPEIKDEVGAEITIVQQPTAPENAALSEVPDAQIDEVVATNVKNAATSFSLVSDTFTAKANKTANPKFSVEFYAYIDTPEMVTANNVPSGTKSLEIIDTSGKKLPQNNRSNAGASVKKLLLAKNGNFYTPKTKRTLTEMYDPETNCEYIKQPGLAYFNKLQKNGNYQIDEIWIKKADGSWDKRNCFDANDNPITYHFTNNPDNDNLKGVNRNQFILITDGTVIRLINKCTSGDKGGNASFYDYNISDGKIYTDSSFTSTLDTNQTSQYDYEKTAGNVSWMKTSTSNSYMGYGINSSSNYTSYGSNIPNLAFGQNNTGIAFRNDVKNGLKINRYESKNYAGCNFGLVSGLDSNGHIIYNGVYAPKLFNEGDANGKVTYDNGFLSFNRIGDTYTLSTATADGSKTVTNLGRFNNPSYINANGSIAQTHNTIFTNDFWPLDGTKSHGTPGNDMYFGNYGKSNFGTKQRQHSRFDSNDGQGTMLPPSDDGLDHNSYFGMNYEVNFSITEDYRGPLDYLFFGDDDLWVFLDGKLVVDIGGVHSSVGEYVDLRDYLPIGSKGDHKLSIFYTERGASGSTCYMNFTLPSASIGTTTQQTGYLKVQKMTEGNGFDANSNEEFTFNIKLTDKQGKALLDDFNYTRVNDKDESRNVTDLILSEKPEGTEFSLRAGEYVLINYLPEGTKFEISETSKFKDGSNREIAYTPAISINGSEITGTVAVGTIGNNTQINVLFVNRKYELPDTGGIGTHWYGIGGGALIVISVGMLVWRRRTSTVSAR